ncbi:PadR family transcriptional regulator [Streptomyces sp. NPDC102405]|uniref:PadR family transcriptional regulator n=1 Tax=Streptomyces sp. NPDC102405 TaxID=3366170 RepID=UPI00380CA86F
MDQKHLTPAMVRIIQAYLEDPTTPMFATELMTRARVGSGSLYPALARMEAAGWIVQEKEDIDPSEEGRPARRYFSMTGKGAAEAHVALVELSESVRPPANSPGWNPEWHPASRIGTVFQRLASGFRAQGLAAKGI